jgi:outer membrane biosynthesis protein TonB
MASFWMTFQNAGFYAYGILLCAMIALAVGVVALVGSLAWGKSRAWLWVAAAGLSFTGMGLSLGGLGNWLGRRKVDEALSGASVDWTMMERIYVEGYSEARDASVVALLFLGLPLLIGLGAAGISAARARTKTGARPGIDLAAMGLAVAFALLGAVSSLVGLPSGEDAARERARTAVNSQLKAMLARTDCDVCEHLGEALQWRGAEQLEADVPGVRERARKCVDDRLAEIEKGKSRSLGRCSDHPGIVALAPEEKPIPEEKPSEVEGDTGSPALDARARALRDAAEFGMIGLLGGSPVKDRKAALEELRDSPLLIDEAQKKKVADLIAEEEAKAARPATPEPIAPSGDGKGNVRVGATSVNGRLPPEVIQRVVRQNQGRFRACYEDGLKRNPNLEGRVSVRFVIGRDGTVSSVANGGSDLPDATVVACVARAFQGLTFPAPEGGIVTVSYPLVFSPGT